MNKSEKFWNRISKNYDSQSKKDKQIFIKTVENTKKHLSSSDIVLDYACGTGGLSNKIAGNVKEVHAIDISSGMIDLAKRKAVEHKNENINFVQSTLFEERHKKESFNVILAFNILHLLEDTQKVLQRINELLKPEGLFISKTVCMGKKKSVFGIFIFLLSKIGIFPYVNFLQFSDLEDLITNGNFQIIETEKSHHALPSYFIVAKKI